MEDSFLGRIAKISLGSGCFDGAVEGVVENPDADVTEWDFLGLLCWALVKTSRVGFGGVPGTVE